MDTDIRLFVDPYALHVSADDWLRTCGNLVANYFQLLIESLKVGDKTKTLSLLSNLHEPNETRLGLSRGKPSGRGWGHKQADMLFARLSKSRAVVSGRLKDLGDFELLIPGVSSDKISDLTINVIRGELAAYTEEQCALHGIEVESVAAGVFWNPDEQRWESHYARLPVYEDKGIILVPKLAVRRRLVPDPDEFYGRFVLHFLEAEHLRARDALVYTLKNGDPKVFKRDLRAKYKMSKEFLFEFALKNPHVLNEYKATLPGKAAQVIEDEGIESQQLKFRRIDRSVTSTGLREIPAGRDHASQYHDLILGALTELFYPALSRPKKEQPADEGRKRIDILFTNSASKGFFSRLVNIHKYFAPYISVECKNYSGDVANPEFDQLLGRLTRKRGFVGILVCRRVDDRATMLKRCQDVVNNDDKKLILILDDSDICAMLEMRSAGNINGLDEYLERVLEPILM